MQLYLKYVTGACFVLTEYTPTQRNVKESDNPSEHISITLETA